MLFASPVVAQVSELDAIDAKRAQIERIVDAIDDTSEELRDGMQFRIDALTTELADQLLEMPVGQAESPDFEEWFHGQLDWLKPFVVLRFERLQERIREEARRFDEFDDSALAAIARAFQNDLRSVSANYIEILADLIVLQESLGRFDESARQELRQSVTLYAERLSGQIMLDAMTLAEFREMVRVDPDNTELLRAARAVERKQNRTLNALQQLVGLMERLDLPVGAYRALLLDQRGTVGVDLLDREVFSVLLSSRLKQARERLLKQGPNIVFKAIVFSAIVLLAYFIAKLVQRFASLILNRESVELHQLMRNMLISVSFGVVFAGGVVVALSTIGISLVPMLAGLGVAGIVIGFALQDTLSNFASGWMILVYRPYDIDDHVKVGGVEGVVKRMNLVSTTIATFDNQSLVIPNSRIWGDVITNLTANRTRRLSIPVSVAYGEDLDRVEQVLREEIERQEGILKKPEPNVFVDSLGSSEIVMMTHAWVRTEDYWTQLRALTKRLKQRLDDEDMEIPFPQQDIYIRSFPVAGSSSLVPADDDHPRA
ncbi:MAG: mechanosensitive ion channel family protein [Wenzhouxiangella sp.]|jgi:small conductance mechanosensitive channel|nr:mechanosensitive ion channel family protein [Wenzhouxiangella sp.]